jgi:D-sedoheptulose 7-phosphate isomerase
MAISERIESILRESIDAKRLLLQKQLEDIEKGYGWIHNTLANGNKLLIFGNGGSAADSQHFASEIVGRCVTETSARPAIALTADPMFLTAAANDYGFEWVFARQIEAYGVKGDLAIGISTSGNSPNVLKAFEIAKSKGLATLALLGRDGGKAKAMVDMAVVVPSIVTPRIQEMHITIIHIWCQMLEEGIKPV